MTAPVPQQPKDDERAPAELSELSTVIDNVNIKAFQGLISPSVLNNVVPVSNLSMKTVLESRKVVDRILKREDKRFFVIVGPCSIHDFKSAIEYAQKLKNLREKYGDALEILMRVYFEKPRTTVGWKGFVNDPDLNGDNNVNKGLLLGRLLLSQITHLGVPTACEFLETFTPQYISEFVSYAAIGARTTPCPMHQKLSSGLTMPVGIKNLTDGDIKGAANACAVAKEPQNFLGITKHGVPAYLETTGNSSAHVILRGGSDGPNYSLAHIRQTAEIMSSSSLVPNVVVDTSHANSQKKHKNQLNVISSICEALNTDYLKDTSNLCGVMIESHLNEGNQSLDKAISRVSVTQTSPGQDVLSEPLEDPLINIQKRICQQDTTVLNELDFGVSITDACIGWEDTEKVLEELAIAVRKHRM